MGEGDALPDVGVAGKAWVGDAGEWAEGGLVTAGDVPCCRSIL